MNDVKNTPVLLLLFCWIIPLISCPHPKADIIMADDAPADDLVVDQAFINGAYRDGGTGLVAIDKDLKLHDKHISNFVRGTLEVGDHFVFL